MKQKSSHSKLMKQYAELVTRFPTIHNLISFILRIIRFETSFSLKSHYFNFVVDRVVKSEIRFKYEYDFSHKTIHFEGHQKGLSFFFKFIFIFPHTYCLTIPFIIILYNTSYEKVQHPQQNFHGKTHIDTTVLQTAKDVQGDIELLKIWRSNYSIKLSNTADCLSSLLFWQ